MKKDGSLAKKELINYIEMKSGYVLDEGTEPGEIKFNIFDHQPRKRNDSGRWIRSFKTVFCRRGCGNGTGKNGWHLWHFSSRLFDNTVIIDGIPLKVKPYLYKNSEKDNLPVDFERYCEKFVHVVTRTIKGGKYKTSGKIREFREERS